jgi:hypothetical protein
MKDQLPPAARFKAVLGAAKTAPGGILLFSQVTGIILDQIFQSKIGR